MTSLEGKMKHYAIVVTIFILLFALGYLSSPFKPQFLGLIVGLTFSFINLWTTFQKAKAVGEVATKVKNYSLFSFFIAGFGVVIRITLAITCVWLALIFPDQLHLISVITGFALIYVIIMADMLVQFVRKR